MLDPRFLSQMEPHDVASISCQALPAGRRHLHAARAEPGRGVHENKRSTDVEFTPPPPRLCMSIHPEGESCSDLGRLLVLNDPLPGLVHAPPVPG
jgi:hypothetical protein